MALPKIDTPVYELTLPLCKKQVRFRPFLVKEQKLMLMVMEERNPEDIVTFDVPLFIRLLEFAREDATDDATLHKVTENIIAACQDGQVLTMDDYDKLVDTKEPADTSNMTSVEDGVMSESEYRWYKIAGIK